MGIAPSTAGTRIRRPLDQGFRQDFLIKLSTSMDRVEQQPSAIRALLPDPLHR
jgi:hypothetical protein